MLTVIYNFFIIKIFKISYFFYFHFFSRNALRKNYNPLSSHWNISTMKDKKDSILGNNSLINLWMITIFTQINWQDENILPFSHLNFPYHYRIHTTPNFPDYHINNKTGDIFLSLLAFLQDDLKKKTSLTLMAKREVPFF